MLDKNIEANQKIKSIKPKQNHKTSQKSTQKTVYQLSPTNCLFFYYFRVEDSTRFSIL